MKILCALVLLFTLAGCVQSRPVDRFPANTEQTDTTSDTDPAHTGGRLLSAFFGLDNGLPRQSSLRLCRGAGNADGMPVIFAHEVDTQTLQAGDGSSGSHVVDREKRSLPYLKYGIASCKEWGKSQGKSESFNLNVKVSKNFSRGSIAWR